MVRRLKIEDSWPDSWKYSYPYDQQELWNEITHYGYAYGYEHRRRETLRLLQSVVPKGSSVLDVAGAQGNFSLVMAELGYDVTWNDLREDLAEYVERKREHGNITYAPGNVFELGFDSKFDAVLITEIIEHVAHPDEFLRKIGTMVKPGGYVIMSTPNGAYFKNNLPRFSDCEDPSQFEEMQFKPNSDGHIFLLWRDEVEVLAQKAGLHLEEHTTFTNPLTAGHVKLETALKLLPKFVVDAIESTTALLPLTVRDKITTGSASRFQRR